MGAAALPIRINVLMPGKTGENVADGAAAARGAAHLMADITRHGNVYVCNARHRGIEEATKLSMYRSSTGEGKVDDDEAL